MTEDQKQRRPPTWGASVPYQDARALRAMTKAISAAERAMDARAERMAALHAAGFSFDAIATAAGVTREAARKSVNRWRESRESGGGSRHASRVGI